MPQSQEVRLPAVVADRLLEVPDYQRPYAWREKQLNGLWEDLDLLGSAGTHYAGTLVVRDIESSPGAPRTSMDDEGTTLRHRRSRRWPAKAHHLFSITRPGEKARLEVLDGSGIDAAGPVARNIRQRYGFVRIDNTSVPRLSVGRDLNNYWVSVVLGDDAYAGPGLIARERRLRGRSDLFDVKLGRLRDGVPPAEEFARLRELQRRITDGLGFPVYEVGFVGEVGVIFETLNERGRPLGDLEKTKNYLLRAIAPGPGPRYVTPAMVRGVRGQGPAVAAAGAAGGAGRAADEPARRRLAGVAGLSRPDAVEHAADARSSGQYAADQPSSEYTGGALQDNPDAVTRRAVIRLIHHGGQYRCRRLAESAEGSAWEHEAPVARQAIPPSHPIGLSEAGVGDREVLVDRDFVVVALEQTAGIDGDVPCASPPRINRVPWALTLPSMLPSSWHIWPAGW